MALVGHPPRVRPRLSDPGGEVVNAAIGSEDWAKRWRLELQFIYHGLAQGPERLARYVTLGAAHDVWCLLNKPDGTRFASFEEFCEEKEPWGLGSSRARVEAWIAMGTRRR